ncbi:MAG: VWA domain-containing protein, partial [Deltaproteobacteria bacterium]
LEIEARVENFTNEPVSSVRFRLDGHLLAEVEEAPYIFTWHIEAPSGKEGEAADFFRRVVTLGGEYTLSAVAHTPSGIEGKDAIHVEIRPPLALTLRTPKEGAYLSGIVPIEGEVVAGRCPLAKVGILVDGTPLETWRASPPTRFTTRWDTTKVPTGTHRITAYAENEAGARVSEEIEVHIARGRLALRSDDPAFHFPPHLTLILDASGSMWGRIGGMTKIEIAQKALVRVVEEIPDGKRVGLWVYGRRSPRRARNCRDVEELVPMQPVDRAALIRTIETIRPRGMTPLADTLTRVAEASRGISHPVIVLVTDGKESCEGDPCAVIRRQRAEGADLLIHVVGFDIQAPDVRSSLACIAEAGGGTYFDARSPEALSQALASSVQLPFAVYPEHAGDLPIATGTVGGEAVTLPFGTYRVEVPSIRFSTTVTIDHEGIETLDISGVPSQASE